MTTVNRTTIDTLQVAIRATEAVRNTLNRLPPMNSKQFFNKMHSAARRAAAFHIHCELQRTGVPMDPIDRDDLAHDSAEIIVFQLRREFTNRFGFAVITDEAVTRLTTVLKNRRLLEVGAGNGYLAFRLQNAGLSVTPTDLNPPANSGFHLGTKPHTAITTMAAQEAIRAFPDHDLVWCWPTMDDYTGHALAQFQGELLVYIGEDEHGCTGSPYFHRILAEQFHREHIIRIPTFPGIHDALSIYRRR